MRFKRFVSIIGIVILLVSSCGCFNNTGTGSTTNGNDLLSVKRPSDFPNSRWASYNPSISFNVDNNGNMKGEAVANDGSTITIALKFDNVEGVSIYKVDENTGNTLNDKDIILKGVCNFGETQLIVTVRTDILFNKSYNMIVFAKEY